MMHLVSVIIPAYNEANRIEDVLEVVQQAALVNELLVIDDGSSDGTADVVDSLGINCFRLQENQGKGAAMRTGALRATGDILLFLDADLRGMTPKLVDALIAPILEEKADMSVGTFYSGRTATDLAQRISPNLSGQRCLTREFFLSAPLIDSSRSGVEIALTIHARACKRTVISVPLEGVTHPLKEEKIGLAKGIISRSRMFSDILSTMVRYQFVTRFPGRATIINK